MHRFYEECAYFTAARYLRKIEQVANRIFKPTGLAPTYSYIMLYLEDYGASSITDIAQGLGYERTTVSRLVNNLVKRNFVDLTEQGRKTMVSVSMDGEEFLVLANQCLTDLKQYTDNVLGPAKAEMTDLLTKNYQKLERSDHDDNL